MTGNRPYRPALTDTDAISELQRCAGTQFDPAIVAALVELLAHAGDRDPGAPLLATPEKDPPPGSPPPVACLRRRHRATRGAHHRRVERLGRLAGSGRVALELGRRGR
jgi:hypothetical protein